MWCVMLMNNRTKKKNIAASRPDGAHRKSKEKICENRGFVTVKADVTVKVPGEAPLAQRNILQTLGRAGLEAPRPRRP